MRSMQCYPISDRGGTHEKWYSLGAGEQSIKTSQYWRCSQPMLSCRALPASLLFGFMGQRGDDAVAFIYISPVQHHT